MINIIFSGAEVLNSEVVEQGNEHVFLKMVSCDEDHHQILDCRADCQRLPQNNHHNCKNVTIIKCNINYEIMVSNTSFEMLYKLSLGDHDYVIAIFTIGTNNLTVPPKLYELECLSEDHMHHVEISGSTQTLTTLLIPASTYNCCASASYENYTIKGNCSEVKPSHLMNTTKPPVSPVKSTNQIVFVGPNVVPQTSDSTANTVGGVLGFIIVVLLIFLTISGIALVCLLRPDLRNRMLSAR